MAACEGDIRGYESVIDTGDCVIGIETRYYSGSVDMNDIITYSNRNRPRQRIATATSSGSIEVRVNDGALVVDVCYEYLQKNVTDQFRCGGLNYDVVYNKSPRLCDVFD